MDEKKIIDPTGIELKPGEPENCAGVDECCDECDYYLKCFPDAISDH